MTDQPATLTVVLRLAGWSPRQLVNAINIRLASQGRSRYRLDPTAAYSWVKQGYRPRPPIPDVAAAVLSEPIGHPVAVSQLCPGTGSTSIISDGKAAADDLDDLTSVDDVLGELAGLTTVTAAPAGLLVGASGVDLTAAVASGLPGAELPARHHSDREHVPPPQADLITSHVAALRRLDDRHGGGAVSLRYVGAELRNVIDLVGYANYEPCVGRQLLASVADLAQLLGWLQFDSGHYGAAERYLLLSVSVARALDDSDRAANAIGMLSYVSAFAGHGLQALNLAEAAQRESPHADPLTRARLLGRGATAAAAAGDAGRFQRAADGAMQLVIDCQRRDAPAFLYYLAPEQLAAEAGQGLVALAEQTTASRKHFLTRAITTLTSAVAWLADPGDAQPGHSYQRSALLHGTFLARAHLMRGDLEPGAAAIRYALGRLDEVQSPRGRAFLRGLRPALARRSRSAPVAELLPEFDRALPRA